MGHPGRESMLKQLQLSVWWPGITKDTKELSGLCKTCVILDKGVRDYPMRERETPDHVW